MSGKEYTEKERREAIIDCAGSYHPAVGGKFLPWNPWLHIRKTYTDEIDRLEQELAESGRRLAVAREALETVARLPIARMYPDGPCLERSDMEEVRNALTLTAPKP